MKKRLSMFLLAHLLLLSPLNCSEETNGDIGVVAVAAAGGMKFSGKMSTAGQAFCSINMDPNQMIMFQYFHDYSTHEKLADCSELRIGSHVEDDVNKKIKILDSVPMFPDGPQIQLSFYDWHGNVTPTKMNNYHLRLSINNWTSDALATFCTLTSYEATLTAKWGKLTRKTRAMIYCDLRKIISDQGIVPLSMYMAQYIYKLVEEVAKLVSFYQWRNPSSPYKISGLDIVTLDLKSHAGHSDASSREFQMTAALSFSTSLKRSRVVTSEVLARSGLRRFENIDQDDENNNEPKLTAFSLNLSELDVKVQPCYFRLKRASFRISRYHSAEEVALKPYEEARLVMVVKKNGNELKRFWWFMSPFTAEMWLSMAAMTVFTGFVIWLIEHQNEASAYSQACRQVEAVFCFPFAFFFNEYRPRNRLSYFVLVPWLILTLIVTTTFTASVGSMVTSSQVVQSDLSIDSLKMTNADIACDGNPLSFSYLDKNLGFNPKNIVNLTSINDFSKALSSGNIKAAFLMTSNARLFLANYCREGFTISGLAFDLSSFRQVFPSGSQLASNMPEAILELKELGESKEKDKDKILPSYCSSSKSDQTVSIKSLGVRPFSVLFILSGSASTAALLITIIRMLKNRWQSNIRRLLMGRGLIWVWLTTLFSHHNQTTIELSNFHE